MTSTGPYTLGTTIRWELIATNTGLGDLKNVSIAEQLAGVTAVNCTPVAPATLTLGESMTCFASHVVTQGDVDAGQIANTATATAEPTTSGFQPITDEVTVVTETTPSLANTGSVAHHAPLASLIFATTLLLTGGVLLRLRRIS